MAPAISFILLLLAITTGCSRSYYRVKADDESYTAITGKAADAQLPPINYSIDGDPRSRFFSPFDPDYPPMPPDDPLAHRFMHRVDGMKGWKHWHDHGDTNTVENPLWLAELPRNDQGVLVLNADDAVRVARINSNAYQNSLEELYLSALDVTFERFRFDYQFFGGIQSFYTADGRLRSGTGEPASNLEVGTFPGVRGIRMEKLFPTGAELVVGFANSIVYEFSGDDSQTSTTLLDFALLQPLLRYGGRARVLERLTIAERTLLYNVRQMERYREAFYVDLMTGRAAGNGPQRRGGVFGGSGLEGFTGVGGGGFGRVTTNNQGSGVAGGAGAAQAGGFMGLLQTQQNIRNQEANIAALRSSLAQLEAFFEAGRIDYFQVELARQALYNAQSRLLTAKAAYESTLDRYKANLGMPPSLPVEISDTMLDRFNLIDSALVPIQNQITDLQVSVGQSVIRLLPPVDGSEASKAAATAAAEAGVTSPYAVSGVQVLTVAAADTVERSIAWTERLAESLREIRQQIEAAKETLSKVQQQNLPRAQADLKTLKESLPARERDMAQLAGKLKEMVKGHVLEAGTLNADDLRALPGKLETSLIELTARLERQQKSVTLAAQNIDALMKAGPTLPPGELIKRLQTAVLGTVPTELSEISASVLELTLLQAQARTESIVLQPVELNSEDALTIAAHFRLDWRNASGSLVDTWRLIEFNANDLQSELNLVFSGDIANVGSPLELRSAKGRLRVGFQFDAAITRLAERNNYRQSLIEYQQARRQYYTYIDSVSRGLRDTLRTIELNRLNFELRRAAVHVAISQVELARLRLQEPPRPGEEKTFSNTTARDLVTALADLLAVQDDFLSVWVNYEVQRRVLDLDLGTMQLDPDGIWLDPGMIGPAQKALVEECDPQAFAPADTGIPGGELIAPGTPQALEGTDVITPPFEVVPPLRGPVPSIPAPLPATPSGELPPAGARAVPAAPGLNTPAVQRAVVQPVAPPVYRVVQPASFQSPVQTPARPSAQTAPAKQPVIQQPGPSPLMRGAGATFSR